MIEQMGWQAGLIILCLIGILVCLVSVVRHSYRIYRYEQYRLHRGRPFKDYNRNTVEAVTK